MKPVVLVRSDEDRNALREEIRKATEQMKEAMEEAEELDRDGYKEPALQCRTEASRHEQRALEAMRRLPEIHFNPPASTYELQCLLQRFLES